MLRNASPTELDTALGQVLKSIDGARDSLIIRENGEATAVLLTGADYQQYRAWVSVRAWEMIEATRAANAHLASDELDEIVELAVQDVRQDRIESHAAS